MNYSIIIPIYNEGVILPELIKRLNDLSENYQIIIINDGSNDTTEKILSNQTRFHILKNKKNRGKGYSIRKGITKALYENIILIDGDLEINVSDIPNFIKIFEKNKCKTLLGCRWYEKKISLRPELIGNFLLNTIFNVLFNTKHYDVLCCLKIIKKDILESLKIESNGFNIEVEILSKICLKKIETIQFLVDYNRRSSDQGKKIKFSDGFKILSKIIKLRITSIF